MSDNTGEVADDVKKRINERFEKLFVTRSDGKLSAYVCIVCDRLLKPKQVRRLEVDCLRHNAGLLSPSAWNAVDPALSRCYKFATSCDEEVHDDIIENMLLSPRASFVQNGRDQSDSTCVSSCCSC